MASLEQDKMITQYTNKIKKAVTLLLKFLKTTIVAKREN